jgi:membrane associated rhomboid family serine protease
MARRESVIDFMVVRGVVIGFFVGGLIGTLIRLPYLIVGVQIGAAAGGLSGLAMGLITMHYFSPINSKTRYRVVTGLVAFIISGLTGFVLWMPMFGFPVEFLSISHVITIWITAIFGALGSQVLVVMFMNKRKKKKR